MRASIGVALVALALAGSACGSVDPGPGESATAHESSSEAASPSPPSPAELARWREFRLRFGLRYDDAWILALAADPATQNDSGVPLLPAEIEVIGHATSSLAEATAVLRSYGELHPDAFAGVGIAEDSPLTVVLYVTKDADEHQAAADLLLAGGQVKAEVRSARTTLADLRRYQQQVEADTDWLADIGARLLDVDISIEDNYIRIRYEAASDALDEQIVEHYGEPPWLRAEWEGVLPWRGPTGSLEIRAIDNAGRPRAGILCDARPVDPVAQYSVGVAIVTDVDGTCTLPNVPAASFTAIARDGDREWTGPVQVPTNGTGRVTIIVP